MRRPAFASGWQTPHRYPQWCWHDLSAKGRSRHPQVCEYRRRIRRRWFDEYGKARGLRDELMQELELLGSKLRVHCGQTGNVAAWPVEARDKTGLDRVHTGRKDDRDGRGRSADRAGSPQAIGRNDDGHTTANQIGSQFRQPTAFIVRPADAVERAADALHCRWVDAEPLGNDPYARPPRSCQSLTDSFLQRRGYVSSLLLGGATMSQRSSLTQSAHFVRQALTAYSGDVGRGGTSQSAAKKIEL